VSDNPLAILQNWADENSANELPMLVLPGDTVSITECATNLFKLIGPTKLLFMRGGAAMILVLRDDGLLALGILHPDMARSFFEKFAQLFARRTGAGGNAPSRPPTASLAC
jgi:hypothetical protein